LQGDTHTACTDGCRAGISPVVAGETVLRRGVGRIAGLPVRAVRPVARNEVAPPEGRARAIPGEDGNG